MVVTLQMDALESIAAIKPRMTNSIFGKRRTFNDLNRFEIAFLCIGVVTLLTCLGLTIERLDYLSPAKCPHPNSSILIALKPFNSENADAKCGSEFTFALLVLINCCFCLFHVIHGVIWERPYELYVFTSSIFVVSCYCVMDFVVGMQNGLMDRQYTFEIKLTRLVILLTLGVADVSLACRIAFDFLKSGRFACNLVQTYDAISLAKVKWHFFTQSLVTFDLEFQVTMIVLILRNGFEFRLSSTEAGILIGGGIFTVIWIVCANLSLRYENRTLTLLVLATSVLEPAYIIYKIVNSAGIIGADSAADRDHLALHYCIFLGGSLGIVIRLILVGSLCKTLQSFGENLNEKIYGQQPYGGIASESSLSGNDTAS